MADIDKELSMMEHAFLTRELHNARAERAGLFYRIEQYKVEDDQERVRRLSIEYNVVGVKIQYFEEQVDRVYRRVIKSAGINPTGRE